jgi:signal transduction histidine kinase
MLHYASGAAYLDRTGAVVAADAGFLAALGLAAHDPTGALRERAESSPELRAFILGQGPDVLRLGLGEAQVELRRQAGAGGVLVVALTARLQECLEQCERSNALSRVIGGVAHDIKNPLNAMALQLAILSEKLSGEDERAAASGSHLAALREQVARVNEVLRRFLDVTDPGAPLGYVELGALAADVAGLYAHEARRRRIQLVAEPPRGAARTAGDPARVGRLLLVLLGGAMASTPDGGRVEANVENDDGQAILRLSHAVGGDGERESGYDRGVVAAAAAALGATLTEQEEEGVQRVLLRLPRIGRT